MNCWSHRPRSSRTSHSIDKPLYIRWWPGLFVFTIWSATELKKKISGGGLTFGPPQYLYHGYALALMSKPLATKVSTPLSENVQIGPKVSIFCVATIIFQHCLKHGVHQSFTGCHWSPLLHFSMMTSRSWWMLEILRSSTFRLWMPHRLTLPSASLARQWSSRRCVWGRYHVGILPCGPVSEGRGSCSASVCHSTCWHSWFPQWTVAPQCRQHSCSPRPTTMLDCRQYTLVFVLLTCFPPQTLDTIWTK